MNWIKCLLFGHSWKVRYVSCKSVHEVSCAEETIFPADLSDKPGEFIPVNKIKRRAIICDRCGKELKVG